MSCPAFESTVRYTRLGWDTSRNGHPPCREGCQAPEDPGSVVAGRAICSHGDLGPLHWRGLVPAGGQPRGRYPFMVRRYWRTKGWKAAPHWDLCWCGVVLELTCCGVTGSLLDGPAF